MRHLTTLILLIPQPRSLAFTDAKVAGWKQHQTKDSYYRRKTTTGTTNRGRYPLATDCVVLRIGH
jgi:hypothetical protein